VIVISNTSPITNLAAIGRLSLLQDLYDTILIPEAVNQELRSGGDEIPGSTEVKTLSWIQTHSVSNPNLALSLRQELDAGESEAIALAVELQADLLLLDERLGYQVASRFGLKIKGVLGVLISAKYRGLIPSVKPLLDELIGKAGFWITPGLYHRILQLAEE
jgi:predicted nucleic acid-binding protein